MPDMNVPSSPNSSIPSESAARRKRILSIQSFIPRYWKPIILLLFITPILTELLTNNIPFHILFRPKLFLALAILVYGPVLLLRELAIRWNLRLTGYILLGLVYGIYNEGLFAKTIFKLQIANTAFDHYGIVWDINLPWAAVIIVFHAFYAFLFPLVIVYSIFPKQAFTPWINKKWWTTISAASFLYISYKFLKNTWPVTPLHYVVLIAIMATLTTLSRWFKGGLTTGDKKQRLWLVVYGIIFVAATFTVTDIIARSRIHFLYFLVYSVMNLVVAAILLDRKYSMSSLLIFSLAAQSGFAVAVIIVSTAIKSATGIITGSAFVLVFAAALIKLMTGRKANAK
jgi:hypothetical protein